MQEKYLPFINKILQKKISKLDNFLIFGQNINTGTYISGLTRNFKTKQNKNLVNTPNSESSLIGMGFGIMMKKKSSIYFGKQLDFVLLGVDHFVNTLNQIKVSKPDLGCFTIFLYVCDQGYQGPQSSFNSFSDLVSLCGIDTFQINSKYDAKKIIEKKLSSKGFKIIGISSKLCKQNILDLPAIDYSEDLKIFQYLRGNYATLVSFNFSLMDAKNVADEFYLKKKKCDLFHLNYSFENHYELIIRSVKKTGKAIFFDDSKSSNLEAYKIINLLKSLNIKFKHEIIKRKKISWEIQHDDFKFNLKNLLLKF